MDLKTANPSQFEAETHDTGGVPQQTDRFTGAVVDSTPTESLASRSRSQPTKRPVVFENWEGIRAFCKKRKLYPVVQKRDDVFVLIKAFSELGEARQFIQKNTRRGPHYVLWYAPESFS